ncbi:MAG: hypothetical protein IJX04_03740 [Oscillospiraceae bacterium]|nr:hypothetical protein [Oscillospiraceae bacterium]
MSIRFCEFCSTVHPEELTHCPDCGARLIQEVEEAQFNDPANPWPFVPVDTLCLRIQGRPRTIRFSGTHSVYHLWSRLHSEYEAMRLCWRARKDEMELVGFPAGDCPEGHTLMDPGMLLGCKFRKFSFHTYEEADPEVAEEPGGMTMSYQGSFEIEDCPRKEWGNVLGWLMATAPRPAPDDQWTYDI